MVKVASSDIVRILRRFGVAVDDSDSGLITYITTDNPSPTNTRISFRLGKEGYIILFDDTAEDDEPYIISQLIKDGVEPTGELIRNPETDITTYAISYEAKDVYLYKVTPRTQRLDVYLADTYPEYSRSTWQKFIGAGYVNVNGVTSTSAKMQVGASDVVLPEVPQMSQHEDKSLPVLYQDAHVIVIDKPVGVLTHSKGALNDEFTVASFFARFSSYKSDTNRPGIVHRLDRDTSGVMIGALDDEAGTLLGRQFSDRKAKKVYYAVVSGVPKQPEAVLDLPIGRNPSSPSTFRVDASGKAAQTYYKVEASDGKHSLLRLEPKTGRTHQLRVHLAYIGCPILGDKVYGKQVGDRLYLHAHQLEITIPGSERKTFISPVPESFSERIDG